MEVVQDVLQSVLLIAIVVLEKSVLVVFAHIQVGLINPINKKSILSYKNFSNLKIMNQILKIKKAKRLSKKEQHSVNGGFGNIIICTMETDGQTCFDTPSGNPGICMDGVCYDC
ncbi:hypothetical protein D1818_12000 [Aquimarina sp. BL5]|nr:hypothetical protein D1818_12000 [Aquimarina sp. BL5]RKN06912.1 hypothetical protein D7036_08270 [Aquimarina sp. BL5]